VRLAERPDILTAEPPRQDWLLARWDNGKTVGVLPRGKTGLLTSAGGAGKTYLVSQLAIAVATGGFWLETFCVLKPGHVLLALAEEELEEAQRRIWRAANAADLSAAQRAEAAQRIDLLPLHGVSAALTSSTPAGAIIETAVAAELRTRLEQRGVEWALVVLDPLSRWAGGGIEGDNEGATRFVQVIETLTSVPGRPSVLVAHHSSKISTREGSSDARGVSAIRDGFRWQAAIDVVEDEHGGRGLRFRNKKSNYSVEFPELTLVRNTESGTEGTLRLASAAEAETLKPKPGGRAAVSDGDIRARVLDTVRRVPGLTSATQIAERTQGAKGRVLDAVKALRLDGRIIDAIDGSFEVYEPSTTNGV
jgi:RecA-family ATPase